MLVMGSSGANVYLYALLDPLNLFDPLGLKPINDIVVNQSNATITVNYADGSSNTMPAMVGGPAHPGSSAPADGTVSGTAWGAVSSQWSNTDKSWNPVTNPDQPFGAAIILLKGTDGRHIHGTNGPLKDDIGYLGGPDPDKRKQSHGCVRIGNTSIGALKGDVDETLAGGGSIPVQFR